MTDSNEMNPIEETTPKTEVITPEATEAPKKPSRGWRVCSIVLFVLAIASVYFGICTMTALCGGRPSFSTLWACFLFLPLPAASLVFAIVAKVRCYRFRKNVIVACVMIPVLCLLGALSFVSPTYVDPLPKAEEMLEVDLPQWETMKYYSRPEGIDLIYGTTYAETILQFSPDAVEALEASIAQNPHFITDPSAVLLALRVSYDSAILLEDADYYFFYNTVTEKYNEIPEESGTYRFFFAMYNAELAKLYFSEYEITYEK